MLYGNYCVDRERMNTPLTPATIESLQGRELDAAVAHSGKADGVFHPGKHLLDELNARGWSQVEFAWIVGRPVSVINKIVNGRKGITPDTANQFAAAFGTSAEIWMKLQTVYDLWKNRKDVSQIEQRCRAVLMVAVSNSLPPGVGTENGMLVAAQNAGEYPESGSGE